MCRLVEEYNLNNSLNIVKYQQGAVLLEAMIAILIFSFGILAISGLQGAMVKNVTESNYRAEAAYIVQQQIGLMWTSPDTYVCVSAAGASAAAVSPVGSCSAATYNGETIDVSARLPNGSLVVTRTPNTNTFEFDLTWLTPGDANTHRFITNASIDANL
jgi:type IV pilus assembly protein PilV